MNERPHRTDNITTDTQKNGEKKGLGPRINRGLLSSINYTKGQDAGNAENAKRSQGGSFFFSVLLVVVGDDGLYSNVSWRTFFLFIFLLPILPLPFSLSHPLFDSTFINQSTRTHCAHTHSYVLCLPCRNRHTHIEKRQKRQRVR